jgi:hypothetical protein
MRKRISHRYNLYVIVYEYPGPLVKHSKGYKFVHLQDLYKEGLADRLIFMVPKLFIISKKILHGVGK